MNDIAIYLEEELRQIPYNLFNIITKYIEANDGYKVAFVGGLIRDKLIAKFHKKVFSNPIDIDIVVEGSSISLAKFIKKNISNVEICLIKEFNLYNTVELNINDLKIDIASARKEIYPAPGLNPSVSNTTIIEDLKRRDFSINAIAFELSKKKIYDPYQGVSHIKSKQLNLLHENSIQDDPSRLLRCAKYASRLDFNISNSSLKQSQDAVNRWPWQKCKIQERIIFPPAISIRIRMELSEIVKYDDLPKIVSKLNKWGLISILDKSIKVNNKFLRGLNWLKKLNGNYLLFLLKNTEDLENTYQRFFINKKEKKIIKDYLDTIEILEIKKDKLLNFSPSNWTEFIENKNIDEEAVKLIVSDGSLFWRQFFRWLFIYRYIKSKKNGETLKKEGWQPGEMLGNEIKRLRYIEIDKINKK